MTKKYIYTCTIYRRRNLHLTLSNDHWLLFFSYFFPYSYVYIYIYIYHFVRYFVSTITELTSNTKLEGKSKIFCYFLFIFSTQSIRSHNRKHRRSFSIQDRYVFLMERRIFIVLHLILVQLRFTAKMIFYLYDNCLQRMSAYQS